MDHKFTVHCETCGCSFELSSNQFKPLESVSCQNCGTKLDDDAYKRIKDVLLAFKGFPEEVRHIDGTGSNVQTFKIS